MATRTDNINYIKFEIDKDDDIKLLTIELNVAWENYKLRMNVKKMTEKYCLDFED